MKIKSLACSVRLAAVSAGCCLLLGACATRENVTLQPVGPVPGQAVAASTGSLVVYSAYALGQSGPSEPDYNRCHSDYTVYANGQVLRSVSNRGGPGGLNPALVDLPPGKYEVYASDNRFGWIHIPVVIDAGARTEVHLDGASWSRPTEPTDPVRLPDGRIVGWQAAAN